MSTKIPHGYRLAQSADLWQFLDDLRTTLNPMRDRLDAAQLASHATMILDNAQFGLPSPIKPEHDLGAEFPPLFRAWHSYEAEQATLKSTDLMADPNRFDLSIGREPATGRIMLLRFCEQQPLIDLFEAMSEVEPYPYWNNTDRPDELTQEEWDARGAEWDRLVHDGPAAESTLTFHLRCQPSYSMDVIGWGSRRSLALDYLPDDAVRAERVLNSTLARQLITSGRFGADVTQAAWPAIRLAAQLAHNQTDLLLPHLIPVGGDVLSSKLNLDEDAAKAAQDALAGLAERIIAESAAVQP